MAHPTDTLTRAGLYLITATTAISIAGFAALGWLHAIEKAQEGWGEDA